MPIILRFNIESCTCGEVFKTGQGLQRHCRSLGGRSSGHEANITVHIEYDSRKGQFGAAEVKTGRAVKGYES